MTIDTSPLGVIKAFSYGIVVPVLAYTGFPAELVAILCTLVVLDVFTGAIREWLFSNFNSTNLIAGMFSKVLLILVPFILVLVGKGAYIDMTPIAILSISTMIIAEGYSIIGNIVQIRNKDKSISEQDAITFILRKAQSIIKNMLENIMRSK